MNPRSRLCAVAAALSLSVVPLVSHAQVAPARSNVLVFPSLRGTLGMGSGAGVAPDEGLALVGGLTAGLKLLFPRSANRNIVLVPDLGFSSTQGYGAFDRTLWSAGLSPGYLWGAMGVAWAPRMIVGTRNDQPVWGVRNGLRVYFIASLIDLEVAHQYTVDSQASRHEMMVSVSLDVGLLAGALYMALHQHGPAQQPPPRPVDAQIAR